MVGGICAGIFPVHGPNEAVGVQTEPEGRPAAQQVRGCQCLAYFARQEEDLQPQSMILALCHFQLLTICSSQNVPSVVVYVCMFVVYWSVSA